MSVKHLNTKKCIIKEKTRKKMKNYGEEIKYQRETHKVSQRELARLTGISQQNISRWENNLAIPSIENCERLADFYGITLDELVGRKI